MSTRTVAVLAVALIVAVGSLAPPVVAAAPEPTPGVGAGASDDRRSASGASQGGEGGRVTVYVLDGSGRPVHDARVEIDRSGSTVASGFTDGLGTFTAAVDNGTYEISARAGGYEPRTTTVDVAGATVAEVRLGNASGVTTGYVDFALDVQGRHTGCSIDASYGIEAVGNASFSERGTVGADGRVETTLPVRVGASGRVRSTDYRITVDEPGYQRLRVTRAIGGDARAHVRLDPAKGAVSVTVNAEEVGRMEPARNATVTLTGRCPGSQALAVSPESYRTNRSGAVTVDGLPPAEYAVNVTKFGYESATRTRSLGANGTAAVRANLSLLAPSALSVGVEERLTFTDGRTFAGPRNATQPLPGATVTVHDLDEGDAWTRTANASGIARLDGLPPGRYAVTTNKSAETRHGARVGWRRDRAATVLGLGETARVNASLRRNESRVDTTAVVDGAFLRTRRSEALRLTGPAAGAEFKLKHAETGTVVTLTADEAGGIAESLPTGAYEVWTDERVAWPPAEPAGLATHVLGPGDEESSGDAAAPPTVSLDDGEEWTGDPGLVLVPQLGTLSLDVRTTIDDPLFGTFENPVENASVRVTDSENHTVETRTNSHGRAVFPRIHPGNATVTIGKSGYRERTVTIPVTAWSEGKRATAVRDGSFDVTDTRRVIEVDGGGSFEFTIEEYDDEEGDYEPADGMILVASVDDDREERYHTFVEDGDSLGPFPPGEYELFLQTVADDDSATGCEARFVIPKRRSEPGPVSFQFGRGTGAGVSTLPMELNLRDNVTDEPIETAGNSDVELAYRYEADPCEPSTRTETKTFRTGADGEAIEEVRFEPRFEGGFAGIENLTILNPQPLARPYAAVPTRTSFPLGLEYVFHVSPNSATVSGRVTSTEGGPLPNATVRIGRLEATTNVTGGYEIAGVPNGTYRTTFTKRGYYSNVTEISVEVPPGDTAVQVEAPEGQPVALEPLPEPRVTVEQPMQGVFLEGVPFEFAWNVTVHDWALEPSRPGGDDGIESITYYAVIDGNATELDSKSLNLGPDDLPADVSTTVNPAELTGNLGPGEVTDIETFYVVLETRKQGDLRYPDPNGTRVGGPAVVDMPAWLEATYAITSTPEAELVTQLSESTGAPERVVRTALSKQDGEVRVGVSDVAGSAWNNPILFNEFLGTAPRFTAIGGMRFDAYRPADTPDSANYEFAYAVDLGAQSFPAGEQLLEKTGLTSIGMPMVNLTGELNGTAFGEVQTAGRTPPRPEYESDAGVSVAGGAFVSADERVIPFAPPISGGLGLEYAESANADLPRGSTNYTARVDGEGNVTTSLQSLTLNVGKGVPVDVKVDALFEFHGGVGTTGPGFASARTPPVFPPTSEQWTDTGNLTVGAGGTVEAGWGGLLSYGQRFGLKGNLTDFRVGDPVFSGFHGVHTLDHSLSVLTIGGRKTWAEFDPIHVRYAEGSESTIIVTETTEPGFRVDRYWTDVEGYDGVRDWSGSGVLVERAHPHANPRVAADGSGTVRLVAGHDRAGSPVGTGLTLRQFVGTGGTDGGLARQDAPFAGLDGTFSPAVAAGNGTTWTAFARFEAHGEFPTGLTTSEIHYAARTGGGWSEPVRVTDNGYTESAVRIAACGPDRAALVWNADRTSLTSIDDVGLRYAVVNATGVVRGPTTVETAGVRGQASVACHGESVTIAYPVAGSTGAGEPTDLARPNATVVVRQTTPDGVSAPETVGTGSAVEAIDAGDETALVAYLDRTRGRVAYALVTRGSVAESGTVAEALATDLALADAPGDGTILAWTTGSGAPGDAAIAYATHDGTNWTDRTPAVEDDTGHRTWLSAAVDRASGTLYLASLDAPTPAPIHDRRTVDLAVDTVDVGPGSPGDPAGRTVRIGPAERTVSTEATATFDVAVTGVAGGVGGYKLTVNTSDAARARIVGAENRIGGTGRIELAADGSGVRIGAFAGDSDDTGTVTVATVTVAGVAPGTARLSATVEHLSDEAGDRYAVAATEGATVTVREPVRGPEVVAGSPARDPDEDGVYEDVNGDGDVTPGDATVLFDAVFEGTPAVTDNPDLFDLNGDGEVTAGDATVLFDEAFG